MGIRKRFKLPSTETGFKEIVFGENGACVIRKTEDHKEDIQIHIRKNEIMVDDNKSYPRTITYEYNPFGKGLSTLDSYVNSYKKTVKGSLFRPPDNIINIGIIAIDPLGTYIDLVLYDCSYIRIYRDSVFFSSPYKGKEFISKIHFDNPSEDISYIDH